MLRPPHHVCYQPTDIVIAMCFEDIAAAANGPSLIDRVRTLTGKEIELDIEPEYKVLSRFDQPYLLHARA